VGAKLKFETNLPSHPKILKFYNYTLLFKAYSIGKTKKHVCTPGKKTCICTLDPKFLFPLLVISLTITEDAYQVFDKYLL
jgi:hypothetical protein